MNADSPTADAQIAAAVSGGDTSQASAQDLNADASPTALSSADEERVQKAESFLRNAEIENVSSAAKREFLERKVGMSSEQIDLAMERVAKREGIGRLHDRNNFDGRERGDRSNYADRGSRGFERRYEDDGRFNQYSDRRMPDRRNPYETFHAQPQYYGSNNISPYNNSLTPEQIEDLHEKSGFSFTSLAGGFSLGVFCLAALRWLNGGDFVLFPPPTASGHQLKGEAKSGDIDADETSELNEQEEEEATSFLGDITEENDEEVEDEYEMNDETLSSILNGTSNAQNKHPAENQPSYEDLVSEIRALTSAVHSYREEQQRTNRAAAARVGRGVTDDVMDFLRVDKNKSKGSEGSVVSKCEIESATSLLKEISDDLTVLKQTLGKECCDDNDDSAINASSERETTAGESLLSNVNSLIERLQKAIEYLETPNEKKSDLDQSSIINEVNPNQQRFSAESSSPDGDNNIENRTEIADVEPQQSNQSEPITQDAQQIQDPASKANNNSDKEHETSLIVAGESAKDVSNASDQCDEQKSNTQDVEQALRTLSKNNSEEDLKVGAQMLYLYCMNISKNPSVPRYRKIYTNNSTFQKKVGNLDGADELLCSVGFVKKTNCYEWTKPNDSSMETQSSLDLALVALDMLRTGTKDEKEN
jgi:hypothetical protein